MKDLRLEMARSMADGDTSFEAPAHDLRSFGGHAVWFGLYFLNAFFTVLPRGVAKGISSTHRKFDMGWWAHCVHWLLVTKRVVSSHTLHR